MVATVSPSRGSNMPAIGNYNQTVILDAIRRAGGLSRVEIAQLTGLTAQTVGNASRRLLRDGLIHETGSVIVGPGQPRRILALRAEGRFSVGVHLDPAVMTFVVLDLEGSILAHAKARTPSRADPSRVIDIIAGEVRVLTDHPALRRDRVLGVGIAAPGPIDLRAGIVIDPPMLPRWQGVLLRKAVSRATGLSVLLDKDVIAGVVGEVWMHHDDVDPGTDGDDGDARGDVAFIYYGTGLGSGIVVNNAILRGKESIAGNIGHITVDDSGAVCTCGRRGCLGALVTPQALVLQAIERGVLGPPAVPVDEKADMESVEVPFRRLVQLADNGHLEARAVLHGAGERIARAIVVMANLLDMDRFVFGGPFWQPIAGHVLDPIRAAVASSQALVPRRPMRLSTTRIGEDVIAVGAGCLVLDATMSPHSSSMLISTQPHELNV